MRRLLVPMVLGVAVAVAGCKGISTDLSAGPTPSHGHSQSSGSSGSGSSGSGSPASTVQAAGPVSAGSGTLKVLSEPQAGLGFLYALINGAKSSIDLTMYTLRDTTAEGDLAKAAKRGVDVRVILDRHLEKKFNTTSYNFLSKDGVHVTWAPAGMTYHQKTLTVDNKTSAIMTLNLNTGDYAGTRDFAVIDTAKADVTAVVTTFNADFAHKKITPPDGADLVWSPTNSQAAILAVIAAARKTLSVENEEMGDPVITSALEAAAKRGVNVEVTMTAEKDWDDAFSDLSKAGAARAHLPGQHQGAVRPRQGGRRRRRGVEPADVRRLGELLLRQPAAQPGTRHPHHQRPADRRGLRRARRRLQGRDAVLLVTGGPVAGPEAPAS